MYEVEATINYLTILPSWSAVFSFLVAQLYLCFSVNRFCALASPPRKQEKNAGYLVAPLKSSLKSPPIPCGSGLCSKETLWSLACSLRLSVSWGWLALVPSTILFFGR